MARSTLPRAAACWSLTIALAVFGAAGSARAAEGDSANTPEGLEFYEANIRPLLVNNCLECHGEDKQGGLQLDSRAAMLAGTDQGPSIVPGKPEQSRLIAAVSYKHEIKMPPEGKLPDEEVAKLEAWIRMGAPAPEGDLPVPEPSHREAAAKSHWAFQPVVKPPVPAVRQTDWPQTPLDNFILARLEAEGLTPSPPADPRTIYRRASFDVTGLPPAAADVERIVASGDSQAVTQAAITLLDSPHYGERWARHWLDVARYADSKGYLFTEDRNYPNAYKYRDWVVQALNADMPYNEFLIRQIAADRLDLGQDKRDLAAMGFLLVGRRFLNNKHDIIDDRIDVLTRGTMALTVTCARCHDHKYDPIPTKDYYSLYGVLASSVEPQEPADFMTLADAEQPFNPHVFIRGNSGNPGEPVPRQFLAILSGDNRQPFQHGSGRLELAQAIASDTNPLTSRVIVNRVWMYYFGRPLVDTPSDFGLRSEEPTHPELLDYLAATLVENNWSLKSLHRMILASATYQQASADRPDARARDPENRLLWRMNRKRLDLEAMRDSLLAVSGQLDLAIGGPAVELWTEPWPLRRTIYGRIDRQNLPNVFRTFDFASPDTHSPRRYTTTVPQQALFMLNSSFVRDLSHALSMRKDFSEHKSLAENVEQLYQIVLARKPTPHELELGVAFLERERQLDDEQAASQPPDPNRDPFLFWRRYVQTVLLSNEFVFVD
jgi:mono/diheme cytochrome c family protein